MTVVLLSALLGAASVGHARGEMPGDLRWSQEEDVELGNYFSSDVAMSPDGAVVYSSYYDRILVMDTQSGKINSSTGMHHANNIGSPYVALSPDGSVLYASSPCGPTDPGCRKEEGHSVIAWDTKTYEELFRLKASTLYVTSMAPSSNGEILFMGCLDGFVRAWDLHKRTQLYRLHAGPDCPRKLHSGGYCAGPVVVPSPDDSVIYTCCGHDSVQAFSTETREQLFQLDHKSGLNSLVVSADGGILYTGCNDGVGRAWDSKSHKLLFEMRWSKSKGNNTDLFGAASKLSPDGSILYSYINQDIYPEPGNAKAWNAMTGEPLFELRNSYSIGEDKMTSRIRDFWNGSNSTPQRNAFAISPDGATVWGVGAWGGEWAGVPTSTACTSRDEDPYATGVKVPCCSGLEMELKNWNGDGSWFYKCAPGPGSNSFMLV